MRKPIAHIALLVVSAVLSLLGFAVVVLALVGHSGNWNIFGYIGNQIGQSLLITAGSFAVIGTVATRTSRRRLGIPVALVGVAAIIGGFVGGYSLPKGIAVSISYFAGAFALAGTITVFSLAPPRLERLRRAMVFVALGFVGLLVPAVWYLPFLYAPGPWSVFQFENTVSVTISGLLSAISMLAVFLGLLLQPRQALVPIPAPRSAA